ncbi:MAG: rhomboid family intramembrane serine protease [Paludibacteraceae bacterium]|nr:rhomboid family intramembrane serine protease [Paludibacteraceae bacterium]
MSQNRSPLFDLGPGVKNLIIINLLIWLFDITNCNKHLVGLDMHALFGLHYWELDTFKPFQMISYMFLHDRASLTHVFFNMFNLWMFGSMMERHWGTARFLIFYFICGIGGAVAQQVAWSTMIVGQSTADLCISVFGTDITNGGTVTSFPINIGSTKFPNIIQLDSIDALRQFIIDYKTPLVVGASGATFGVMTAFAMCFPNLPLYFFFIPIPIKAKYMISFFVLLEIVESFVRTTDGIAHLAHLGGVLFGILLILWWRRTGEDQGPMF